LRTKEALRKLIWGRLHSGKQHLTVKHQTGQECQGVVAILSTLLHDKGV
jgi:hypothetical protein